VLGHGATSEALREMSNGTMIYQDQNKRVRIVPESPLSVAEARKEIIRHCFRNFGAFTAENLSRYVRGELPMKELRSILADLEKEGLLAKGFLVDGDESVYWMVKEDVKQLGKVKFTEEFVLGPEDNLHVYLADRIRQNLGGSYFSLIMDGPRMIGSFRGRVKATDITLQDFNGDKNARAVLTRYLKEMGLTLRVADDTETIPDWEVQAFYEKTHPGEV
jgi:ATP-dependent Lhr-like helicase